MRTAAELNRRYFHDAYESGKHGWQSHRPSPYVEANLRRILERAPAGRLLDLGCGEGRHCLLAAHMGFEAVGVDLEPLAIYRAREQAQRAGLHGAVQFVVADILTPPFAPGAFDVLVDYGCLHHQPKADWARYLAAVRTVLKPGGYLTLSVFSTAFRTFGPQHRPWHLAHGAYRRFFTPGDLHALFDEAFEFAHLEEEREGVRGFWHALLIRRP
jgi:SAM-dependent methyltransferase